LRYRDSFAACRRYPSATHSFGPALGAFLERINQMFYFRQLSHKRVVPFAKRLFKLTYEVHIFSLP
jgi:hypothetical protein